MNPPSPPTAPPGAARSRRVVAVIAAILIGAALLLAVPARAQLFSASRTASLNVVRSGALGIVVLGGSGQSVMLADGTISPFANPISVRLDWNFQANRVNSVALVGYFTNAAAALVSGPDAIPSGWVEGRLGTTGGWAPFTQSNATPAAANASNSLLLHTTGSTRTANRRGTVTLDVYLRLNLTGRTVLPGDYTGTLVLQAFSQ